MRIAAVWLFGMGISLPIVLVLDYQGKGSIINHAVFCAAANAVALWFAYLVIGLLEYNSSRLNFVMAWEKWVAVVTGIVGLLLLAAGYNDQAFAGSSGHHEAFRWPEDSRLRTWVIGWLMLVFAAASAFGGGGRYRENDLVRPAWPLALRLMGTLSLIVALALNWHYSRIMSELALMPTVWEGSAFEVWFFKRTVQRAIEYPLAALVVRWLCRRVFVLAAVSGALLLLSRILSYACEVYYWWIDNVSQRITCLVSSGSVVIIAALVLYDIAETRVWQRRQKGMQEGAS